jgi:hypothetical protein
MNNLDVGNGMLVTVIKETCNCSVYAHGERRCVHIFLKVNFRSDIIQSSTSDPLP